MAPVNERLSADILSPAPLEEMVTGWSVDYRHRSDRRIYLGRVISLRASTPSSSAFDNRFRDAIVFYAGEREPIARREDGFELSTHRCCESRNQEWRIPRRGKINEIFNSRVTFCVDKFVINEVRKTQLIRSGIERTGCNCSLKGRRALEAPRIWLQLHFSHHLPFPSQFTFTINLQIVPIYPPLWKWKHHAWGYIEIPCITAIRGLPRGALTSSRLFPQPQKLDARKISRPRDRVSGKKTSFAYRHREKVFDSRRERFIFPPLARTSNFTSPEAEGFNQLGETEFSGALKGRSRGWTRVFRECPTGAKWCRSMDGGGHHRCAALAARIFDGLAVASATHGSFVEFHAIWVNGRADQTAPIFCRPILAPPRNVNDTANLVSMPATTQCRGLVDVLLSLSLFLSMLTTHGIGVLTLLVFLSALRFAAMLESCYQVSHTHTHTLS